MSKTQKTNYYLRYGSETVGDRFNFTFNELLDRLEILPKKRKTATHAKAKSK